MFVVVMWQELCTLHVLEFWLSPTSSLAAERFDILVPAYPGCPGILAGKSSIKQELLTMPSLLANLSSSLSRKALKSIIHLSGIMVLAFYSSIKQSALRVVDYLLYSELTGTAVISVGRRTETSPLLPFLMPVDYKQTNNGHIINISVNLTTLIAENITETN